MSKIGVYLLLLLAAASFVATGVILIDRNATDRAAIKTERQNNAAGNGADDARSRFDGCSGGMWDFGTGRCRGTSPRGGN